MKSKIFENLTNLCILLLIIPLSLSAEPEVTVSDVSKALMCTCGCTMVLYSCQCGTADRITTDIDQMINNGWSKAQILDAYVEKHGQTILAAPPKQGFNLSAWVMPFLALAGAAVVILVLLKRWSGKPAQDPPIDESLESINDDPYLSAVEEELQKIED